MKHAWLYIAGLVVLGMMAFGIHPANAATGAGPYYATPSWDQTLPASTRFIVLTNMNNEAVLDRETGLVWEQSPSTSRYDWLSAQTHCNILNKGGRLGWRLPTIQELASLVDMTQVSPFLPSLPSGHPFSNVQSSYYWSATSYADSPSNAWVVDFGYGYMSYGGKSSSSYVWCVRGGHGVDPQ